MPKSVPSHSTASAVRGLWFVFNQDGHTFAIFASALTGKEEVYLDGQLVAVRRKIAFTSAHTVQAGEREYTITLSTPNLKNGVFHATLAQSGTVLQGWRTRYVTRQSTVTSIATIVVAGALVFMLLRDGPSPWYLVYGVALVAVGSLAWATAGKGYGYVVEPLTLVQST